MGKEDGRLHESAGADYASRRLESTTCDVASERGKGENGDGCHWEESGRNARDGCESRFGCTTRKETLLGQKLYGEGPKRRVGG
jgi:hypothetical protein